MLRPVLPGGDLFHAWYCQVTIDYMPRQFITWRAEYNHRQADMPYLSGPDGLTLPGGNQGAPGSMVDGWSPDPIKTEDRLTGAMLIRY
jgi:hypothetical protein